MLQAEEKGEQVTAVACEYMDLEQRMQHLDELRAQVGEQHEMLFRVIEKDNQQRNAVFQREHELRAWEHRLCEPSSTMACPSCV